MQKKKTGAIILAAGQGKRMQSRVAKQFLELKGRPLLAYTIEAFEKSRIDEIILVTRQEEMAFCKEKVVRAFGFSKVSAIVAGGKERCHSVYEGLKAFGRQLKPDYVLIHDGARPLVSEEVIERALKGAVEYGACVTAKPVKDTIKISSPDGFAAGTPERKNLWQIQTPQAFQFDLIMGAYEKVMVQPEWVEKMTDDAMAVELAKAGRVKLVEGDYRNMKITTPEDMVVAEALL